MDAEMRRAQWWSMVLLAMSLSAVIGAASSARADGTEQVAEGAGAAQSHSQYAQTASANLDAAAPANESFRPDAYDGIFSTNNPPEAEDPSRGDAVYPSETTVAAIPAGDDRPAPTGADRKLGPADDESDTQDSQASEDYDPWEGFNSKNFWFNLQVDRFAIKPLATAWETVVPEPVRDGVGRMFDNLRAPGRFINNLAQGKFEPAARELTRFIFNSVFGLAGFFDVGKREGVLPTNVDSGQTFAHYGAGPGPYLVLPFLPPLTVRDAFGYGVDAALNPMTWVAPFAATASLKVSDAVNDRSFNLETFENVEAGSLDLYGAVRNGYLSRREKAVRE